MFQRFERIKVLSFSDSQVRRVLPRRSFRIQTRKTDASQAMRVSFSKMATTSSDMFFPCGEDAASAAEKDFKQVTNAIESLLRRAGSNFELEITSTHLMMQEQPRLTELETSSYNYNLLLARGASF
jgi:hypothetical protein